MFENFKDCRIDEIETKKLLSGMEVYHVKLYYSDKKTVFFDGWVDENLFPLYMKESRKMASLCDDKVFLLDKYTKVPDGTEAQIVLASIEDKPELQDFFFQMYSEGYMGPMDALSAIQMKIDDMHNVWYVRAGKEIAAAVYFVDGQFFGYPDTLYIENFFVHPNSRNQGVERALINNVAHSAKTKGKKGLSVMVQGPEEEVINIVNFYQQFGINVEEDEDGEPVVSPLGLMGEGVRVMMFGWFGR